MLYYEKKFRLKGFDCIVGVDEAGRGPLAGPVVAAAVALKGNKFKNRIDDSKKLTPQQREKAFLEISQNTLFGIGVINEQVIDKVNILASTSLAMEQAIDDLLEKVKKAPPRNIHILVDGTVKIGVKYPYTNIIRGDARSKSIACASILAKVFRDRIMAIYDRIYPKYKFFRHKGYPTLEHRRLLEKFGPSLIHRKTFLRCLRKS